MSNSLNAANRERSNENISNTMGTVAALFKSLNAATVRLIRTLREQMG